MAFLDIFGFSPDTSARKTALPAEDRIIDLTLCQLASNWGRAHDEISTLRDKYEVDVCEGPALDEALKDQQRLVHLDRVRAEACEAFFTARDAAMKQGYKPDDADILVWYTKAKQKS